MGKVETLKKRKKSSKNSFKAFEPNKKILLDKKLVVESLVEALIENDIEVFRDILVSHIRTVSKTDLAKKTGLGRRTLYDLIENKNFDPRISTLAALLSKISA